MTAKEIKERAKRDLCGALKNYIPDELSIDDMAESEIMLFYKYQEQLLNKMLKIVET